MHALHVEGWPLLECPEVQGGLSYIRHGDGEPVVLIHGSLADCRYWRPQIQDLSRDFLVFAPSLRYYWPQVGRPGFMADFSVAKHAEDISAFIDTVANVPVHLVGHSRGGQVAIEVARRCPAKLATLTLADPVIAFSDEPAQPEGADTRSDAEDLRHQAISWIEEGRIEEGLGLFIDAVMGGDTWKRMNERRRRLPLDNAVTLIGQHRDRPPVVELNELSTLSLPVLLLNGERSAERYRRTTTRLLASLPNARREVISHAGHAMSAENPAAFNDTLRSYLFEVMNPAR